MMKLFPKKPRKKIIENSKEEDNFSNVNNKNYYVSVNIINEEININPNRNRIRNRNINKYFKNKNKFFLNQIKNKNNNLLSYNMNEEQHLDNKEKRAFSPINKKSILSKKNYDFDLDKDINRENFSRKSEEKKDLNDSFGDDSEIKYENNEISLSNISKDININNENCKNNMLENELNDINGDIDNELFKHFMDINNKFINNKILLQIFIKKHNFLKKNIISFYMNILI